MVAIGGDQLHAGQAAGGQAAQERQPPGAVLGGGDVQAQDLRSPPAFTPVAIRACTFTVRSPLADLLGQRVDPHECVRPGVQRPGRNCVTISSSFAAITLTCDFDSFVTPRLSASFSTHRVLTPSR